MILVMSDGYLVTGDGRQLHRKPLTDAQRHWVEEWVTTYYFDEIQICIAKARKERPEVR
jgi:hypothetical protein